MNSSSEGETAPRGAELNPATRPDTARDPRPNETTMRRRGGLGPWLVARLDWFAGDPSGRSDDDLRRARVLSATYLALIMVCLALAAAHATVDGSRFTMLACLVSAALYLGLCMGTRWLRSHRPGSIFLTLYLLGILSHAQWNFGRLEPAGAAWYAVIPVFAASQLGLRWAIVSAGLVGTGLGAVEVALASGWTAPSTMPPSASWTTATATTAAALFAAVLAWIHDRAWTAQSQILSATATQLHLEVATREALNDELEASLTQLAAAKRETEEATAQLIHSEKLTALGELAASIAHELNQPLNVMRIIAQSASRDIQRKKVAPEDIVTSLSSVIQEVDRMAKIIHHMRVFTRNTSGAETKPVHVNDLVDNALLLVGRQLVDHDVQLVKHLGEGLPQVRAEGSRIEQVLLNLLTNARHAVESVPRERRIITLSTRFDASSDHVVIEVRDEGMGVPETLRQKIFQPFFTTKEPGKGTGLGLSVSTKILQEHGGRLELGAPDDPSHPHGSAFRIVLPRIADSDRSTHDTPVRDLTAA